MQLLEYAKKVFSEKGYYDTHVEDIVRLAQIGKGTIYQYFKNKEDIFLSLLEKFVDEWEREVAINIRHLGNTTPYNNYAKNYLHHRIIKSLVFFKADYERSNIVLRLGPGLNLEIESYIKRFEGKVISLIISDLKLAQKFHHIDKDADLEVMANLVIGGTFRVAFNFLVLEREKYASLDLDELAREIVSTISHGIFKFAPE